MITRAPAKAFSERLERYRQRVEERLQQILTEGIGVPQQLTEAMGYSVLGSGKRIRPLLTYATGELFELELEPLDSIAAAVELVHAYSLVHDDLPAMDDDDLRRGKPTTHRKFNEAVAILAGDGLQALAFEALCADEFLSEHPSTQAKVIAWLAEPQGRREWWADSC